MRTETALPLGGAAPTRWRPSPTATVALVAVAAAAMIGLIAGFNPRLALLGAVGLVLVGLMVVDVTVGLCGFIVIAYVEALPQVGAGVSVAKFVGLLLVVSWIATVANRRPARASLISDHPGFTALLILLLAWISTTLLWADDVADGRLGLQRFALNFVLLPIVFTAVRTPTHAVAVLSVLTFGAVLAAVVGLLDPSGGAFDERLSGAGLNPNQLGAVLVVGAVVATALAAGRSHPPSLRVASAVAAAFCAVGVLLTNSRGALVGFAVAAVAAVLFAGRGRRSRLAPLALAGLVAGIVYFAAFAGPGARARIFEPGDGSARADLWRVAWRMVEDRPLAGVGVGNFESSLTDYVVAPGLIRRSDRVLDRPTVPHNIYLQVWAELGTGGLVLFLSIVGFALRGAVHAARVFARRHNQAMEVLARGTFVALMGILAAGFFASWTFSKILWLLLAIAVALPSVARSGEQSEA